MKLLILSSTLPPKPTSTSLQLSAIESTVPLSLQDSFLSLLFQAFRTVNMEDIIEDFIESTSNNVSDWFVLSNTQWLLW